MPTSKFDESGGEGGGEGEGGQEQEEVRCAERYCWEGAEEVDEGAEAVVAATEAEAAAALAAFFCSRLRSFFLSFLRRFRLGSLTRLHSLGITSTISGFVGAYGGMRGACSRMASPSIATSAHIARLLASSSSLSTSFSCLGAQVGKVRQVGEGREGKGRERVRRASKRVWSPYRTLSISRVGTHTLARFSCARACASLSLRFARVVRVRAENRRNDSSTSALPASICVCVCRVVLELGCCGVSFSLFSLSRWSLLSHASSNISPTLLLALVSR